MYNCASAYGAFNCCVMDLETKLSLFKRGMDWYRKVKEKEVCSLCDSWFTRELAGFAQDGVGQAALFYFPLI